MPAFLIGIFFLGKVQAGTKKPFSQYRNCDLGTNSGLPLTFGLGQVGIVLRFWNCKLCRMRTMSIPPERIGSYQKIPFEVGITVIAISLVTPTIHNGAIR